MHSRPVYPSLLKMGLEFKLHVKRKFLDLRTTSKAPSPAHLSLGLIEKNTLTGLIDSS